MKNVLLLTCICFSVAVWAQKKSPVIPAPAGITLVPGKDTIEALKVNDNGLRAVPLRFIIKGKKPDKITANIDLLDYDKTGSKPQLVNAEIGIAYVSTRDSSTWSGTGVCNVVLTEKTDEDEKFFIIIKDDVSAAVTVVAHSSMTNAAAEKEEAVNKTGEQSEPNKKAKGVPYRFDNAETEITPVYTNHKDSSRVEAIKIRIRRDALIKGDEVDTIKIAVEQNVFPYTIKVLEPFILMDSASWGNRTDTTIKVHIQNRGIDDTLKGKEQVAYLKIEGDNRNTFHAIRLTERGLYNRSNPFWMETGANFDLLDGIKANNLYAGIYMFEKDIARIGKKSKGGNNLGFTGGVYESKSSSLSTSSDSGLIYRDGTSYSPHYDTTTKINMYHYYRDTGSITTTTDVQSIGIFFSPHLRLTDKKAEENGFHVFLSAYLEMLWQRVNSNFDYKNLGRDSVFSVSGIDSIYQHPFKDDEVSSDYRTQYFGIGLPLYINDNSFSLYINNAFGWCNQRFVAVQDSGLTNKRTNERQEILIKQGLITPYQNPTHSWNPFYLLQFRLTEEKYGIVFTGEVRGFFLKNSKPVISLALSKKFDLADLFHAIVKPFTPGS